MYRIQKNLYVCGSLRGLGNEMKQFSSAILVIGGAQRADWSSRPKEGSSSIHMLSTTPLSECSCKELLISEVMLLRGFVERDQRNVFGVDLELYDTDDAYKAQSFYRLKPLVYMERCPQISRMLREKASRADKDFVTKLGLRSLAESSAGQSRYRMRRRSTATARRRASSKPHAEERPRAQRDRSLEERERNRKDNKLTTDHQTEPASSHAKPNTRGSSRKELKEVVAVASNGGKRGKSRPSKPAMGKLAGKRDNPHEEDAFTVRGEGRGVRGEGRAKLVSGKRPCARLQPQHHAGTGCYTEETQKRTLRSNTTLSRTADYTRQNTRVRTRTRGSPSG